MKVYIDTSVVISLADPPDLFHDQSVIFIDRLTRHGIECNVSAPLATELSKIIEVKGAERCLDILNAIDDFGINFRSVDMKQVWSLSQVHLDANVLTARHRLDLFHYAAASLLNCTHIASWNNRHFNDKIAAKVNKVNSKHGLLSLIAGKPPYITRVENLGG